MPRPPRADVAGAIYHVLNRGNGRQTLFHKDADYEAFERVLQEGLEKHPVDLLAYQWMPNHWHMVLSPREDGAMSRLMYWTTMTHTARHHAHYHTVGEGICTRDVTRVSRSKTTGTSWSSVGTSNATRWQRIWSTRLKTGGLEVFTIGTAVRAE